MYLFIIVLIYERKLVVILVKGLIKFKDGNSKKNSKATLIISILTLIVLSFTYAFCNIEVVKEAIGGKRNFFKADIASGTCGGCNWAIRDDGRLVLSGNGTLPNYRNTGDTPWYRYRASITGVYVFSGVKTNTTAVSLFAGLENCTWISMANLDTSTNGTTSLAHFFDGCKKMTSLSLPDSFVTTNVVSTSHMFFDCQSMTTIDVSKFNTTNVTNIQNMFMCCYKLETINWGTFNTDKVTNFSNLFHSDYSLTSVKAFSTPKATNMVNMFYGCSSLSSIDLSHFTTSTVTSMKQMFQHCTALSSLDLSNFNMSAVTDVSDMLSGLRGCNRINFGANFKFKVGSTNVNMDSYYWRKDGTSTIWSSAYLRDNYTSAYAGQWIRTYLIRYYQGGNNIGQSYVDCEKNGYLTRYSALGGTIPANWSFYGWSTASTGITKNYDDVNQITNAPVTESILNLYALFSRDLIVQYDGNGNTGGSTSNSTKTVIYNPGSGNVTGSQTISLPNNGYTKEGYSFVGWNTQSSGNGTTYGVNSNYTPSLPANDSTFTVTLYAKWSSNTLEYTVNHYVLNLNSNTYSLDSYEMVEGEKGNTIELVSLSKTIPGFNYVEGFMDSGDTTKPTSGAIANLTIPYVDEMTINLYYRRNYLYLKYNMNGGTMAQIYGQSAVRGMDGEYITINGNPRVVMGLYGSNIGGIDLVNNTIDENGLQDIDFTGAVNLVRSGYIPKSGAQWCLHNSDGTIVQLGEGIYAEYDDDYTGYQANDIANQAGFDLSEGDVEVTLYANWIPCEYNVTFDVDGGECNPDLIAVDYDSEYGKLPFPTKTGYGFLGWSLVPSEYEQIEYIEGNGEQYIDTGYKPNTRTGVDVKYEFTNIYTQERVFGVQGLNEQPGTMNYEVYIGDDYKLSYGYKDGAGNWIHLPIDADTNIHRLKFNVIGNGFKIDDSMYTINNQSTIQSPYNMYIMATNKAVNGAGRVGGNASIRIYDFTIYEAGVLQKRFIPCKRKSDGKVGMYELVDGVFCPSLGGQNAIPGSKDYTNESSIVSYASDHTLFADWGLKNYVVQYCVGNNDEGNEGAYVLGSEVYTYGTINNLKTYSELNGEEIQGWEFAGWNDEIGYDSISVKYNDGQSVVNLKDGSEEEFTDIQLSEGQYVNYYNSNGEKTLCRVLYDKNSIYGRNGIQIISMDNIKNLELNGETTCNLETLNDFDEENVRTDLVQSVRTVGSVPNNKNYCDELSESYEGQKNYEIDMEKMNQLGITDIGIDYWLGSEKYDGSNYSVYYRASDGTIKEETLYKYIDNNPIVDPEDDQTDDYTEEVYRITHGCRHVYTLRQDIRVISGDGSEEHPYELSVYYDDEIIRLFAIFKRTIKYHYGISGEEATELQYYNPYETYFTSVVDAPIPLLTGLEEYNWAEVGYRPDREADTELYRVGENIYVEYDEEDDTADTGEHTTIGEYVDITYTNPQYNTYNEDDPNATVLDLYAVYTRDLTLSYNANGATEGSMESQISEMPQYYNISGNISGYSFNTKENEFLWPGYEFVGWSEDIAGDELIYEGENALEFMPTVNSNDTNQELFAIWVKLTYEITYELNDGELLFPNPSFYEIDTETFTLNNPTKTGFVFLGWTGSNGDVPEKTITIERGSSGDREYIANWAQNIVVVNIDKDNVAWSDSGMYVGLFQDGVEKYSTTIESGSQAIFNDVYDGTYDVYASKSYLNKDSAVDTGIDVVVGENTN